VDLEKNSSVTQLKMKIQPKFDPRWFGKKPKAFVKAFVLFAKQNCLTIEKRNQI
jgi:hypothetical protein